MRMAITAVSVPPTISGPAVLTFEQCKILWKNNIETKIFTYTQKPELRNAIPIKANTIRYGLSFQFPFVLKKEKFDLLHAHETRNFLTDYVFVYCSLKKIPFILQPHGSIFGYRFTVPKEKWAPYFLI